MRVDELLNDVILTFVFLSFEQNCTVCLCSVHSNGYGRETIQTEGCENEIEIEEMKDM